MTSTHQTSTSPLRNQASSDTGRGTPSIGRVHTDMAIYLRRGHRARSQAFHGGLKYMGRALAGLPAKLAAAGDAVESWLFTPFYNGGRKS